VPCRPPSRSSAPSPARCPAGKHGHAACGCVNLRVCRARARRPPTPRPAALTHRDSLGMPADAGRGPGRHDRPRCPRAKG
jgi:hypothetical protein